MSVTTAHFFEHVDAFNDFRKTVHGISEQTIRSNTIDLHLFENFIKERHYELITGPAVMDFQYYLKKKRFNSGPSINRKIFTLKSYERFLKSAEVEHADKLPFRDVLKIRNGYLNRPGALTRQQVTTLFKVIDRTSFLGIRDYAVYGLMYDLGLRVGEVHSLNLENLDVKNNKLTVMGKGKRLREFPLNRKYLKYYPNGWQFVITL